MATEITTRQLFGRTQIYTDVEVITPANVCEVLSKAAAKHTKNEGEIRYLYDYYRGQTPVLSKKKLVRPEINHKISENRAFQITEFKNSACFGEPVRYISTGEEPEKLEAIDELNGYMVENHKEASDRDIGKWMHIAGVGYRMTLPNRRFRKDDPDSGAPFKCYTLDPRTNFIVRHSGIGNEPVMSVTIVRHDSGPDLHCIYTPEWYFEIEGLSDIKTAQANPLGMIPLVEYPLNVARLGAFEIALPLLDAINELESNRLDDVQSYVNSFLALVGASMDEEAYEKRNEYMMLCLPQDADAKYLSVAMQQGDLQTLKDDLYQAVITVCGMPSQSTESTSTSDTGAATLYRGGWSQANARAQDTETEFKRSEFETLRVVLRILRDTVGTPLKASEIEPKFTRRFVDDMLTKTNALSQMLNSGIAPEVAIYTCGLWNDPTDVYMKSKKYLKQWEIDDVSESRPDNETAGDEDTEDVREEP